MDGAPVTVERLADGTPFQPLYGDVYCSRSGRGQAHGVFVDGTGLGELLRGAGRARVVETGFGLGLNASAAVDAAIAAAQLRGGGTDLEFVSIELHPVRPLDLASAHLELGVETAGSHAVRGAYAALLDLGEAAFEVEGASIRVRLLQGDGAAALRRLDAPADALFLDGFAPDRNPGLWNDEVYAELARLARPGAKLATYTVARAVRDGLTRAGFAVERREGFGLKRHRLVGERVR